MGREGDEAPVNPGRKDLLVALWLLVGVGALGVGYLAVNPSSSAADVTELYLLNESGVAADYPDELAVGETGTVVVGVHNDRPAERTYTVVVRLGDRVLEDYGLSLDARERDQRQVSFTPERDGGTSLVVELYEGRTTAGEPGWRVRLPVDVQG